MVDETPAGVVVPANAGLIDGVQSALRSIGLLLTFAVAAAGFFKTKDFAGLVAYVNANGGQALAAVSAVGGFAIYAYGIYKSHKRGAQIATVASNDQVPDSVATTK